MSAKIIDFATKRRELEGKRQVKKGQELTPEELLEVVESRFKKGPQTESTNIATEEETIKYDFEDIMSENAKKKEKLASSRNRKNEAVKKSYRLKRKK